MCPEAGDGASDRADGAALRCPACGAVFIGEDRAFCHRDGTPLQRLSQAPRGPVEEELPAGRLVAGRYHVTGKLGSGSMGTVYAAKQVPGDRPVALKVLGADVIEDETMAKRFVREAQAASRIASPNVVTIYDFGRHDDGMDYLAMERLEGESLGDRLRREGCIRPLKAVEIAIGVVAALRAAHDAGVIHRDLKPDNVFLCADGMVKVLDFGIAKIFGDAGLVARATTLTRAGAITGTPLYMSPEAARRQPVGPAADLYALGVLLHHMLVGEPVFVDDAPIMVLGMHIRSRPQPVTALRPDAGIPGELEDLVLALLHKDPDERPDGVDAYRRLQAVRRGLKKLDSASTSVMSRQDFPTAIRGSVGASPSRSLDAQTAARSAEETVQLPVRARWPLLAVLIAACAAAMAAVVWWLVS